MARKTINQIFCDTCGREIKPDERVYCGIQWSNQRVDTPIPPNPTDAKAGDHCSECFIKHLYNYTKKLSKLHGVVLERPKNSNQGEEDVT